MCVLENEAEVIDPLALVQPDTLNRGELRALELRRIAKDVCVVLSSGYSDEETAQKFIDEGIVGFLPKPYSIDHLSDLVAEVLVGT